MDYLPTLGEKWPHSRGNVGKYSIHGASGLSNLTRIIDLNKNDRSQSVTKLQAK